MKSAAPALNLQAPVWQQFALWRFENASRIWALPYYKEKNQSFLPWEGKAQLFLWASLPPHTAHSALTLWFQKCRLSPQQHTTIGHGLGALQLNSVLTMSARHGGRSHRLKTHSHRTVPALQTPLASSDYHLCLWCSFHRPFLRYS